MNVIREENYVGKAEQVIQALGKKRNRKGQELRVVSTSKLRNLLAMTADIYNEAMLMRTDTLSAELSSRIEYLRIRFVYEAGRDESVKALVMEAEILQILQEIGKDKKNYILFSHYMEALVAFRKYYYESDD